MELSHIAAVMPGKPTEDDLLRAERELEILASRNQVYLSKNPAVRRSQVKVFAQKYVIQKGQSLPYSEKTELEKEIAREHQIARILMGPDSRYSQISYSDPSTIQTKVIKHLFESFHYSKKPNILLLGDTGSGKTYGGLCYIIAQANLRFTVTGEPICDAEFVRAYEISEALERKNWDFLDTARSKKRLMIDDLGVGSGGYKATNFIGFFEDLFTERHENQKQTILTANGNPQQMKETFGNRFISRLMDSGEIYETDDPDFRKQGELNQWIEKSGN